MFHGLRDSGHGPRALKVFFDGSLPGVVERGPVDGAADQALFTRARVDANLGGLIAIGNRPTAGRVQAGLALRLARTLAVAQAVPRITSHLPVRASS